MECIIELGFVSDDPFWGKGLPRVSNGLIKRRGQPATSAAAVCRERMEMWWRRFAELGGEHWQRWLDETRFYAERPLPSVTSLVVRGNSAQLTLHTASDGIDTAPMLVALLHQAGCSAVEALLFTDEAEQIIDDDGEAHTMGLRYFINEDGQLAVADYPEIEYLDE